MKRSGYKQLNSIIIVFLITVIMFFLDIDNRDFVTYYTYIYSKYFYCVIYLITYIFGLQGCINEFSSLELIRFCRKTSFLTKKCSAMIRYSFGYALCFTVSNVIAITVGSGFIVTDFSNVMKFLVVFMYVTFLGWIFLGSLLLLAYIVSDKWVPSVLMVLVGVLIDINVFAEDKYIFNIYSFMYRCIYCEGFTTTLVVSIYYIVLIILVWWVSKICFKNKDIFF